MNALPKTAPEALLRSDLKAEIDRNKTLTGRAGSKPPADSNHQHQVAVTSLYEDMTNILVTGVKFERDPQVPKGSTNYQCVYTQRSETTARSKRSFRPMIQPDNAPQVLDSNSEFGGRLIKMARKMNT